MFGNAVGNAIVAGRVQAGVDERNAELNRYKDMGKGLGKNNPQFDDDKIADQIAEDLDAKLRQDTQRFNENSNKNQQTASDNRFDNEASIRDAINQNTIANNGQVNRNLSSEYASLMDIQRVAQKTRFENSQAAQSRYSNMETITLKGAGGVDINAEYGTQFAEYAAFRQGQIDRFNNYYNELSLNERLAFESGARLMDEVGNYGREVFGDSAEYLVNLSGANGSAEQRVTLADLGNRVNDFGEVLGATYDVLTDFGAARVSGAYQTRDKIIEGKVVLGTDLAGAQGKFPEAGKKLTADAASQLGITSNHFKKDNINFANRLAYEYSNGLDYDLILEADVIKNEINLGPAGKIKYSFGARTNFDNLMASSAVNIGWEPRGTQTTFAFELRGAAKPVGSLFNNKN